MPWLLYFWHDHFYPIASRNNVQIYNSFKGGTHWWGLLSRHLERVLGALLVVTLLYYPSHLVPSHPTLTLESSQGPCASATTILQYILAHMPVFKQCEQFIVRCYSISAGLFYISLAWFVSTPRTEVEFVNAVTASGSVKILPAV